MIGKIPQIEKRKLDHSISFWELGRSWGACLSSHFIHIAKWNSPFRKGSSIFWIFYFHYGNCFPLLIYWWKILFGCLFSFVGELFLFFNNLIKYRAYIIIYIKIAGILSQQSLFKTIQISYIKTNKHITIFSNIYFSYFKDGLK